MSKPRKRKYITLRRNGEDVKLEVVFDIFNPNSPLLEDNPYYSGKNTRDALSEYFKEKGIEKNFIRAGGNEVEYCVSPFFFEGTTRFRAGKRIWYKSL